MYLWPKLPDTTMCGTCNYGMLAMPVYLATESMLRRRTAILSGSYVDLIFVKKPKGKLMEFLSKCGTNPSVSNINKILVDL